MTEIFENSPEQNETDMVARGLGEVCSEFLTSDDAEFIDGLSDDEKLGYVYGRLLEEGHDPDEILQACGVTEGER